MSEGGNIGGVNSTNGKDAVLERYENWAQDYEADLAAVNYRLPEAMARLLGTHVGTAKECTILDAGCGTGLSGRALRKEGFSHLTGIDFSPAMVEIAKAKAVYERLMVGDAASLPFADGAFDHTIAVGTVWVAPPECLAELARVTKVGGLIVFSNRRGEHFAAGSHFFPKQKALEGDGIWEPVETIERLVADDKPGSDPFVVFVYRRKQCHE